MSAQVLDGVAAQWREHVGDDVPILASAPWIGAEWAVGDGPGQVTMKLRSALVGIQYGTEADRYGWIRRIC